TLYRFTLLPLSLPPPPPITPPFPYTTLFRSLYKNHIEQMKEQLSREVRPMPQLQLNPEKHSIFDFEMRDIKLSGYDPHPAIKARSEEHTSELQSRFDLVCRLLLEKKKYKQI